MAVSEETREEYFVLSVRVHRDEHAAVRELAQADGRNVSNYVRRLIQFAISEAKAAESETP